MALPRCGAETGKGGRIDSQVLQINRGVRKFGWCQRPNAWERFLVYYFTYDVVRQNTFATA